jgi:4-amino-4-deoxy-L-arabinose transferase-like glycosyltransferase
MALTSSQTPAERHAMLAGQVAAVAERPANEMPLFLHAGGELWYQPLAVYPAATLMRLGVPGEIAVRLPASVAGVLTIVLVYLFATREVGRRRVGMWAAVLLVPVPAFLMSSRAAGADLLMVPAVLTWCVLVMEHVRRPQWWLPVVGGAALGVSAYTQPAGVLAVPVYFAIASVALWRAEGSLRAVVSAALATLMVLMPAGVWFWRFPDSYPDTFGRWLIHAAHVGNPWEGIMAVSRWHVMARRVGAYWDYLNPGFLFASGEVFGLAMAGLVAVGLWVSMASTTTTGLRLIIASFFAAPVAAVLLDVARSGALAVLLVPFGALLAAVGLHTMLGSERPTTRVAGLLLLMLTGFGPFAPEPPPSQATARERIDTAGAMMFNL